MTNLIDASFPPSLIARLREDLELDVTQARLPKNGMWKSTFLMRAGDFQFVLRVEPEPAVKLRRATAAQERASNLRLPAPKSLGRGFEPGDKPFMWTAEEFIEGDFYFPSSMEPALAQRASRCLGEVLRNLHTLPVNGYGELDPDCRAAEFAGWDDYLASKWRELLRAKDLVDVSAERDEIEEAHHFLAMHPPQSAVLCHGDFADDNILLAADGHVRAIIDWNNCLACDPAYDLAYSFIWPQRIDCLHEMFRGYAPDNPEMFWLRIRAHRLLMAITFIVRNCDRANEDGKEFFIKMLRGLNASPENWSRECPRLPL